MKFQALTYPCPRLTPHNVRQLALSNREFAVTKSLVAFFGKVYEDEDFGCWS
jgi:hypothetical protein